MMGRKSKTRLVVLPTDVFLLFVVSIGFLGYSAGILLGTGRPTAWASMVGSVAIVIAMIRLALWWRKQRLEAMGFTDE